MSKVQDSAITEQMKRDVLRYMTPKPHRTEQGNMAYSFTPDRDPLDLNFLFEVAEKVGLKKITLRHFSYDSSTTECELFPKEGYYLEMGDSSAEALFLALYQAIKELQAKK